MNSEGSTHGISFSVENKTEKRNLSGIVQPEFTLKKSGFLLTIREWCAEIVEYFFIFNTVFVGGISYGELELKLYKID